MPIVAKFEADFESFKGSVASAGASLLSFQAGADKGQQKLLDTIGESGGRMKGFADATGGAVGPVNTLRASLGTFDQALSAMGLNMGREIRAMGELADASGKTVSQLGLLSVAGLAVAAGMGGWKIGRMISEFFGLDEAIGNATSRLMGWGDLVAETAGSKQDVINRAIANGAKETISFSEAIKFNIQHLQDQNDKYAVSRERLSDAQREVRQLSAATIEAIEIAKKNGATTEAITRVHGISADGLRALAERQKLAGQMADGHTKALETQRSAVEKLDREYDKLMSDIANERGLAQMKAAADDMARASGNAAAAWIKAQVDITKARTDSAAAISAADKAYLTEQDALTAATDALSKTHTQGGQAAVDATGAAVLGYQGVAQQVQITGDAIKEWINLMKYSAQVSAILSENSLFTSTSQRQRIAALSSPTLSQAASSAGGGVNVANTFNIVDTEANITRRVSENITRSVMQSLPLGA